MEIDYDRLYCFINDFCKGFDRWYEKQVIGDSPNRRKRACRLSLSENLTILIAYHQSGMSCFKYFYLDLQRHHKNLFPDLVHYDRFVSLLKRSFPALRTCLNGI